MADGHIILDTRVDTAGVTKGFSAIKRGANSLMGAVMRKTGGRGNPESVSVLIKSALEKL